MKPRKSTLILCLLGAVAWSPAEAKKRDVRDVMLEARAARDAGEMERVVELLTEAYKLRPTPQILNNLGRTYEQLGQYKSAFDTYKQVADDMKAPLELRNLDGSRMAALGPKMDKAWLVVAPSTQIPLYVDGKRLSGEETGFPEGERVITIPATDGTWITAHRRAYPVGLRTTVAPETGSADDGWLDLDLGDGQLTGLSLQGAGLGVDVTTLDKVRLSSGPWTVSVDRRDALSTTFRITVVAGAHHSLAQALEQAERVAVAASGGSGPSVLPMITMGAGAVVAAIGGLVTLQGEQDRTDVVAALDDVDAEGNVKGITLAEAHSRLADADGKSDTGTVLIGVGAAVAVGGLVWLVVDGPSAPGQQATGTSHPEPGPQVLWTGNGLQVRGSF